MDWWEILLAIVIVLIVFGIVFMYVMAGTLISKFMKDFYEDEERRK